MPRLVLLLTAAALAYAPSAGAAPLAADSPIGQLVQVIAAVHACQITMTDAQQMALTEAGQAQQDKLKATDADLDALMEKFENTPPKGGCDAYKANFDQILKAAIAGAR